MDQGWCEYKHDQDPSHGDVEKVSSFWDYISTVDRNLPVFFNPLYDETSNTVSDLSMVRGKSINLTMRYSFLLCAYMKFCMYLFLSYKYTGIYSTSIYSADVMLLLLSQHTIHTLIESSCLSHPAYNDWCQLIAIFGR